MKIKMRYDNTYQTLEVDVEKMWVSLSLEAGANITQEEKEQLIQDKVEEIYNKPEYNSWHKLDRHRGEPKRSFRKDDEEADNSDGLDLIPDYSDEERRERKEDYDGCRGECTVKSAALVKNAGTHLARKSELGSADEAVDFGERT